MEPIGSLPHSQEPAICTCRSVLTKGQFDSEVSLNMP
jgi:hypothetical protein